MQCTHFLMEVKGASTLWRWEGGAWFRTVLISTIAKKTVMKHPDDDEQSKPLANVNEKLSVRVRATLQSAEPHLHISIDRFRLAKPPIKLCCGTGIKCASQ